MAAPKEIHELVQRFDDNIEAYRSAGYNETQARIELIDPFFKQLGWDINNTAGFAEAYKDVVHEDAIKVGGVTKAPDYCFRVGGGVNCTGTSKQLAAKGGRFALTFLSRMTCSLPNLLFTEDRGIEMYGQLMVGYVQSAGGGGFVVRRGTDAAIVNRQLGEVRQDRQRQSGRPGVAAKLVGRGWSMSYAVPASFKCYSFEQAAGEP